LQKQLKGLLEGSFEFQNTRNRTTIVTKEMADFSAIKEYLNSQNLNYFNFYPKSLKPIKAVIQHLSGNTQAEEIYEGFMELGSDIISIKQMSTTCRSQGSASTSLPLFIITLPRPEKSHEIFKLTSLCYIAIKVEPYKSQTGLTQWHDCEQFSHIWANCRQPPHCLWRGGGHLHRECPEKGKEESTPVDAIVSWLKGRNLIHLTTEAAATRKRRCVGEKFRGHPSQILDGPSPPNTSRQTSPSRRFYKARPIRLGKTSHHGLADSSDSTKMAASRSVSTDSNCKQFDSRQHGQDSNCMTEFNDAVSKEAKIKAISKIVLTLME
jgi:hypothetical protein